MRVAPSSSTSWPSTSSPSVSSGRSPHSSKVIRTLGSAADGSAMTFRETSTSRSVARSIPLSDQEQQPPHQEQCDRAASNPLRRDGAGDEVAADDGERGRGDERERGARED